MEHNHLISRQTIFLLLSFTCTTLICSQFVCVRVCLVICASRGTFLFILDVSQFFHYSKSFFFFAFFKIRSVALHMPRYAQLVLVTCQGSRRTESTITDDYRVRRAQENRPIAVRWWNMPKQSRERSMSSISIRQQNISIIRFLPVECVCRFCSGFYVWIAVDIRELIEIDDAMDDQALRFGPNGGLIFCME